MVKKSPKDGTISKKMNYLDICCSRGLRFESRREQKKQKNTINLSYVDWHKLSRTMRDCFSLLTSLPFLSEAEMKVQMFCEILKFKKERIVSKWNKKIAGKILLLKFYVRCCCRLNNTQVCDEHLFGQVSTRTGHNQLPIFCCTPCTGILWYCVEH